jgi:hypothetical protein
LIGDFLTADADTTNGWYAVPTRVQQLHRDLAAVRVHRLGHAPVEEHVHA